MKYYEEEHFEAYARIRAEGLGQWNDLHAGDCAQGYEQFAARAFLERALPAEGAGRTVFEYGCGAGGAACFMASRGYSVAEADRAVLLDGVRRWLGTGSRYLLATAMFEPGREYATERYDAATAIVWTPSSPRVDGSRLMGRAWYAPVRRHLRPYALRRELERHGLDVISQTGEFSGEVVCTPRARRPVEDVPSRRVRPERLGAAPHDGRRRPRPWQQPGDPCPGPARRRIVVQ